MWVPATTGARFPVCCTVCSATADLSADRTTTADADDAVSFAVVSCATEDVRTALGVTGAWAPLDAVTGINAGNCSITAGGATATDKAGGVAGCMTASSTAVDFAPAPSPATTIVDVDNVDTTAAVIVVVVAVEVVIVVVVFVAADMAASCATWSTDVLESGGCSGTTSSWG